MRTRLVRGNSVSEPLIVSTAGQYARTNSAPSLSSTMSLGGGWKPSGGGGSKSGNCRSSGHWAAEAGLVTTPPAQITRKATRDSRKQVVARPTLHGTHGGAACF